MKKLYIKTYGCQMNVYDSARMADVLKPMGYEQVESAEGADMVILNTCHIREKAEEKVYSDLGRVRREKLNNKDMIIAVGGCVAQAEGAEVIRRAPYVDMVFGSQSYHLLPELIEEVLQKRDQSSYAKASEDTPTPNWHSAGEATRSQRRRVVAKAEKEKGGVVELDFPPMPKFDYLPQENAVSGVSAMLAVQEGCDKFCTFCVVPYTRGAEYSRKVADVLAEARRLVDGGALEIMLLGQNVNAYHGEGADGEAWSLAKLIRELAKIEGLARIRYTTSHPRDMSDDLIAAHAEEEKLMPYLHLPVQSGSDAVLKRMNRKHTAAHYIEIIERMRAERPDMAFSGDFIVGFPGETDQDFEDTLALVRHVGYASAYSFKYSPRPGTPAATEEVQVAEEVKDERIQRLQALIMQQSHAFNAASVGKVMDVLLDREGKYESQLVGRSPWMQSIHVRDAEQWRGQIIPVRITGASANSLTGEILTQQKAA